MCAKKIEVINPNRYENIIKKQLHVIEENANYDVQQLKKEPIDETMEKFLKENNIEGAIQYKQDLLLKGKINVDKKQKNNLNINN